MVSVCHLSLRRGSRAESPYGVGRHTVVYTGSTYHIWSEPRMQESRLFRMFACHIIRICATKLPKFQSLVPRTWVDSSSLQHSFSTIRKSVHSKARFGEEYLETTAHPLQSSHTL